MCFAVSDASGSAFLYIIAQISGKVNLFSVWKYWFHPKHPDISKLVHFRTFNQNFDIFHKLRIDKRYNNRV